MTFLAWFLQNAGSILACVVAGWALAEARNAKKEAAWDLKSFQDCEFKFLKEDVENYNVDKWELVKRSEVHRCILELKLEIEKQNTHIAILETKLNERTNRREDHKKELCIADFNAI